MVTAVAVAFVVPFAIFAATLRPGIDFWDTGDLQTVPYILGIPYPTGYPGYVLIGWLWTHLIPFGNVAWRTNLLSAAAVALGCAAVVRGAIALGTVPEIAGTGAILGGLAHPVWQMANHADAHAVGAGAILTALAAALWWWRTGERRAFIVCAVAAGLAVAIDASSALPLCGVALVALARRISLRRAAAALLLSVAIAAAAYAYLPLRSAVLSAARTDPTLAIGLEPGRPFWDDHHPSTWAGFHSLVSGSDFRVGEAVTSLLAPATLSEVQRVWYPRARRDFAFGSFAFAIIGLLMAFRAHVLVGLGLLVTPALPTLFALAYRDEAQVERYYVIGDLVLALLLGYGVHRVLTIIDEGPRRLVTAMGIALLAGVGAHEVANARDLIDQHTDTSAHTWLDRATRDTPPNSIVVTPWAFATPLAYGAYVDRSFGDRIVVTAWPNDVAAHFSDWMKNRPLVLVINGEPGAELARWHLQRLARSNDEPRLYEVTP